MTQPSASADKPAARESIGSMMTRLGRRAKDILPYLAGAGSGKRNEGLRACAQAIRDDAKPILHANSEDLARARSAGSSAAMTDRLALDPERLDSIAAGLDAIAGFPDPLDRTLASWTRPNGLVIDRVSVPLGVIGMIYESRPNVTADAAGLCLKSGNAVILRGGSESFASSSAIHAALQRGLDAAGLPVAAVQMVPTTDRAAVGFMLSSMRDFIDVLVPRGGKRLIARVQAEARVPVIGHLEGLCHVYLHASADTGMATEIVLNSKMRRTGICGAAETLLVDRDGAGRLLPTVIAALQRAGCEVRGDDATRSLADGVVPATEDDWSTEYLDAVISVRVVDDLAGAVRHIRQYGSGHTECIVAEEAFAAHRFLSDLDSAILLHNASTQFADGGEFGMGAEIGIATGKLHARGPVGPEQLTSYKYVVRGSGQVRP